MATARHRLRYAKHPRYRYDSAGFVTKVLDERGWTRAEYRKNSVFDWCDNSPNSRIKHVDLGFYRTWQNKLKLYQFFGSLPFLPETYLINNGRWMLAPPENGDQIYFLKNPSKDSARETHLVGDLREIEERSKQKPDVLYIVQPAVGDPLLLERRKFDLRMWCVVTTTDSLTFNLKLFKTGYLKLCEKLYRSDALDRYVHLANVNSAGTDANSLRVPFDAGFEHYEELLPRIVDCVSDVFEMSKRQMVNNTGNRLAWITAWDFLFDSDFNPTLVEINHNPAYWEYSVCDMFYELVVEAIYEPLVLDSRVGEHEAFADI